MNNPAAGSGIVHCRKKSANRQSIQEKHHVKPDN